MARLLVATDLSERTGAAERRAAIVARRGGWDLALVHAVDEDQPRAVVDAHRRAAGAALVAAAHRLSAESGRPCAHELVFGDPAEALAAAARGAVALVLGPHRRRLLRDIFVGTTGERVIRAATVPVLSVHAEPAGPYRRMLLALDGSPASAAVVAAVRALGLVDARDVVAAIAVDAPPDAMLRRAGAPAAEVEASTAEARRRALSDLGSALPPGGYACAREAILDPDRSTPDALIAAAARLGCDVVVLGTRGRGGLEGLLLGGVAAAVLARAGIDVLVVPPARG